uniref:Ig-like domain-containing protein n=1 Tax=Salarias fasciatus TaxID=181472 RepID=A0A672FNM8_SALFA
CICMQMCDIFFLSLSFWINFDTAAFKSLVTVSEVSAKAGGSISIPCLYEPQYTSSIKYLCVGPEWLLCKYVIVTQQTWKSEKRFMIHDDQSRQVFTVTITDLEKIPTLNSVPGLHVDNQEVKGFMGEDLTISCYCSNTGESQWCRLGGPCVKGSAGEIDSTSVIINNNHDGVFTVTMKRLRTESSGWYFCASEATKVLTTFSPTSESVSLTTVSATSQVPTTVQHGGNR